VLETPMLAPATKGVPFTISDEDESEPGLPGGYNRPVLAVPAANPMRCFALALYGPHASGADLDANERAMLKRIAQHAAAVYAEIENDELRRQISTLEQKLSKAGPGSAKRPKRSR
jgi:hypothetical protein